MNLPADLEFHEDIRLLIWRPHGLLNEASVNKVISALSDLEATIKEPFNRFADTLEADAVDLNFRYVLHVSLYRRLSYAGRSPVNSAVLATNETMVHYAKLHALMTQGSPITVRIFDNREGVAEWLAVPIERLTASGERTR
jgi:hypothetical protein